MNVNGPPRAAQYELLDALPNNVTEMKLPNFKCNVCHLFRWQNWQSLGLIKQFYRWTMIMVCFVYFIMFIGLLLHGIGGILTALILMPILTVCTLAGLRIASETITAILIMPHQLNAIVCELKRLNQGPIMSSVQMISPHDVNQPPKYLNNVNVNGNNAVPMAAAIVPQKVPYSY